MRDTVSADLMKPCAVLILEELAHHLLCAEHPREPARTQYDRRAIRGDLDGDRSHQRLHTRGTRACHHQTPPATAITAIAPVTHQLVSQPSAAPAA
jgi:hypothetical protein